MYRKGFARFPALLCIGIVGDQPTYESVNATSEEFAMQHSYFIKGISGLFDPKETRKSAKRIKDSQKNGSDTPFERNHLRKKADRFGHSHEFDTYQTISGDGSRKCVWFVDFAQGNKNFDRITKKSWQDRMRRKKKKAAK